MELGTCSGDADGGGIEFLKSDGIRRLAGIGRWFRAGKDLPFGIRDELATGRSSSFGPIDRLSGWFILAELQPRTVNKICDSLCG